MNEPTVPSKNRIFIIVAGIGIAIMYIFLNIGIWMYASNSKKAAQTVIETKNAESVKESGLPKGIPSILPTPTPTPRLTGPGPYACSIIGMCKLYDDAVRKANCTVTYADPLCLDQCADTTKQCKN